MIEQPDVRDLAGRFSVFEVDSFETSQTASRWFPPVEAPLPGKARRQLKPALAERMLIETVTARYGPRSVGRSTLSRVGHLLTPARTGATFRRSRALLSGAP